MTSSKGSSASGQSSIGESDLGQLISIFRRGLPKLIVTVLISLTLAAAYVVLGTKWYRADTVLILTDDQSIPSLGSQFSGLAALAGVNLSTGSIETEAFAVLKSRDFAREFIKSRNLAHVFVDAEPRRISRFLGRVRKEKGSHLEEAVEYFQRNILRVAQDPKTGVISLTVQWTDQDVVASWANSLAEEVNAQMRERALKAAEQNVSYLREQLVQTSLVGLQQSISRLLEVEMQKLMLARGNEEFAFKIVDNAVRPIKPARPNVLFALSLSLAFGLVTGALIVLFADSASASSKT